MAAKVRQRFALGDFETQRFVLCVGVLKPDGLCIANEFEIRERLLTVVISQIVGCVLYRFGVLVR